MSEEKNDTKLDQFLVANASKPPVPPANEEAAILAAIAKESGQTKRPRPKIWTSLIATAATVMLVLAVWRGADPGAESQYLESILEESYETLSNSTQGETDLEIEQVDWIALGALVAQS